MRLIDADSIDTACWEETAEAVKAIRNAPTVDAVLVVRCKECKEWCMRKAPQQQNKFGFCACNLMDTHGDFFCAYGERRANNV